MKQKSLLLLSVFFLAAQVLTAASIDSDLQAAFQRLKEGRNYKKDFPGQITRKTLVNQFLGLSVGGAVDPDIDRHLILTDALDQALRIRNLPEATTDQMKYAKEIAMEAIEALTDGALIAGNNDLLNGLRVAFPAAGVRPGTGRNLPFDLPKAASGTEYANANLINFGYARLHFLRAIKGTLEYLARDPEGQLRATDNVYDGEAFKTFTAFNENTHLPLDRFLDVNFPTNSPTTTAAYNYGNILQRFAMANTAMAERLWRAAFADRKRTNDFNSKPAGERAEMLAKSAAELRRNIHCQYLCSLPLAATLSEDDYQVARVDQAKVAAQTSQDLLKRVTSGEPPKLDSLILTATSDLINAQIKSVEGAYTKVVTAHDLAVTAIDKWNQAGERIVSDARTLRSQFERPLWSISNLSPTNYNHLQTVSDRRAYREDIINLLQDRLTRDLKDSTLIDGSLLGKAAISILRALNDIRVAETEICATPQIISVIQQEANEINDIIFKNGEHMAAYDAACALIDAWPKVTLGVSDGKPTYSKTWDPRAVERGLIQVERTLELASKEAQMNQIRTAAEVQKLLITQATQVQKMDSLVADLKLATANYNDLANQMYQLVEEAGTYQDESATLWYRDSKLLFQREDAEFKFDEALTDFRNGLYILAKMIETAWGESFQNPYFANIVLPNGTHYGVLGDSTAYDAFTQPESFFNVVDAWGAKDAYDALLKWDAALRQPNVRGALTPGERKNTLPISVRQDLLGYSDLDWDDARQQFVENAERKKLNIRRFQAYLLRRSQEIASPLFDFAFDFGVRTADIRKSTMTPNFSASLLEGTGNDWNQRLVRIVFNFKGQLFQGLSEVKVLLYQYGMVEVPGFFSIGDSGLPARKYNLSQYFIDPLKASRLNELDIAASLQDITAGIRQDITKLEPTDVSYADWSPYCDRYILAIRKNDVPLPTLLSKLEDIELLLVWRRGHPKAFVWPEIKAPSQN